jgi:hypothetical protein
MRLHADKEQARHMPRGFAIRATHSSVLSHTFRVCVLLILNSTLRAQDGCNVEIKLLLAPAETQAAIASLGLKKEAAGHVYFFDTSALDLLSQGAIVRLRQGADNDLTIKLRPPAGTKPFVHPAVGEDSKCEVDLIGGERNPSYSVRKKYVASRVPETGTDVLHLLSAEQEKLLREARISIDWTRVKRISDIQSTDWQTKAQPHFSKLTLELWEWSGGRILELSTKAGPDAGPSSYAKLQQLVNAKGLSQNATQRAKTGMVLETLAHATTH